MFPLQTFSQSTRIPRKRTVHGCLPDIAMTAPAPQEGGGALKARVGWGLHTSLWDGSSSPPGLRIKDVIDDNMMVHLGGNSHYLPRPHILITLDRP